MPTRPRLTSTHTVVTCNIVIYKHTNPERSPIIYVEDFSYKTQGLLPLGVHNRLDPKHVRTFADMKTFTEWLHEESAIVDQCWAI